MNKIEERELLEEKEALIYKAAVLHRPGSITYEEVTKPAIGDHDLFIKMGGVGLCASTIPLWEGREWFNYPLEPGAPGHEGWGIITEVGDRVEEFQVGQRVAILAGNAYAEYVKVSSADVVVIPEDLSDMPFPGEPFGCLMNIWERSDIQEGQTVAIIGLGFLGQGLVKLAKEKGARVLALSRRDISLEMAADAVKKYKMDDHYQIVNSIMEYTEGKGCERVIECTGKQWPLDLATDIIGEYGKLIIAGYHQDGLRNINMQKWNWKAIDVINAHERDQRKYLSGMEKAIKAIQDKQLDPERLLTHEFTFDQLPEAFKLLTECPEGYIKGYINFKK